MKKHGYLRTQFKLLALVVLIGLNLRPFLVAPGPILADIINEIGLSYNQVSILTLLPMLLMGLGAFGVAIIPPVVRSRSGLLIALGLLTGGSLLRLFVTNSTTLIFTAALCGIGVAYIQSILPGMIKAHFPQSTPAITGIYSATLMVGGALGARLMPVFLDSGYDWQEALAWLALPSFIAFIVAFFIVSETKAALPNKARVSQLLRRPRTWTLIAAFGMVNGGYASMVTWLAPFYQSLGASIESCGNLVAVMAVSQAVFAIGLPALTRKHNDRRPWLLVTVIMQGVGFWGLTYLPDLSPTLWAGVCGAGLGGAFALGIVTALDHSPCPETAGSLAALMQGGGFLIASVSPLLFAQLHQWTGEFSYGWGMHLMLVIVTSIIYITFNPKHYANEIRITHVV